MTERIVNMFKVIQIREELPPNDHFVVALYEWRAQTIFGILRGWATLLRIIATGLNGVSLSYFAAD